MPLLSIIVPVYNTQEYLAQCLESIAAQSFRDFECIVVDDGSTDKSALLCADFCKNDSRFQFYKKANGGVSETRNFGIAKAAGEYIGFVDSDDWIDTDYFETLFNAAGEDTLAFCGLDFDFFEENRHTGALPCAETHGSFCKAYHTNLLNSPCNKLFFAKTVQKYDIRFPESYTAGEDLLFVLAYLEAKKQSFCSLAYAGYHYRKFTTDGHNWRKLDEFFKTQYELFCAVLKCALVYDSAKEDMQLLYRNYMGCVSIGLAHYYDSEAANGKAAQQKSLVQAMEHEVVLRSVQLCDSEHIRYENRFLIKHRLSRLFVMKRRAKDAVQRIIGAASKFVKGKK